MYKNYCLFVLSRAILLYRPVIRSSLPSINHYPAVYKSFDVVKEALPAFDGSRYFVHVVLLICLDFGTLVWHSFVVEWVLALYKWFRFRYVECEVSFPLMGEC